MADIVLRVVIAYIYTFYLLSFFFDLSPSARTKDQEELRKRREGKRVSGRGSLDGPNFLTGPGS